MKNLLTKSGLMKKNGMFTENQRNILQEFISGEVREDHCSGEYALYRYSAIAYDINGVAIINENNLQETERNIQTLLWAVNSLTVKPHRVFIYDDFIELEWWTEYCLVLNSMLDYLELSLEFANFIDSCNFIGLKVNTGSFYDDPSEIENPNKIILMDDSITFTNSFGKETVKDLEVVDMRQKVIKCFSRMNLEC